MTVRYPPRSSGVTFHRVTYVDAEIKDQLQLAWATTVHKVGVGPDANGPASANKLH